MAADLKSCKFLVLTTFVGRKFQVLIVRGKKGVVIMALIQGQAFINLYGPQGGRLFKARHLSTFMAIRVGAY